MKKENKYLVSLVKGHPLFDNKEGAYLYTYVSTLVGKNSIDEKYFIDEQGNKYPNIDNWKELSKKDSKYACIGQMLLEETSKKSHADVFNLQDICNAYEKEVKNYCYIVFLDEKEEKKVIALDIKSLRENARYIPIDKKGRNKKKYYFNDTESFPFQNKSNYVDNLGMIKVSKLLPKLAKQMPSQEESIKKLLIEINKSQLGDTLKSNGSILLFGLEQVDRKYLLESICSYINRPLLIINPLKNQSSDNFEEYVEKKLLDLYKDCNGNTKKIEQSIVFFEDIDKFFLNEDWNMDAKKMENPIIDTINDNDNYNYNDNDIYNTFLNIVDNNIFLNKEKIMKQIQKFIDGQTYYFSNNQQIKTDRMIKIIGVSKEKLKKIGFIIPGKSTEKNEKLEDLKRKIRKLDFIQDLPAIIELNDPVLNDFKAQLKLSKYSPMNIEKEKFQKLGTKLIFAEGVYNTLAQNIYDKKIDEREISNIISEVTYPSFIYALENRKKIEEIKIDKNTLEDNNKYKVKYKK